MGHDCPLVASSLTLFSPLHKTKILNNRLKEIKKNKSKNTYNSYSKRDYLQPQNSSKCITKVLNSLLLLYCLQILEWHLFITPATDEIHGLGTNC